MTDIVERLRATPEPMKPGTYTINYGPTLLQEAAAEIERLRAALRGLLDASERHIFSTECKAERDAARAALENAHD